jgi:hypothetical protein
MYCVYYLICKDEYLFVCLYRTYTYPHFLTDLNQTLHMSFPWSGESFSVCVWTHNISIFPHFRPILSGASANSCAEDGCRRQSPPLLRYISRVGVTSRTWRALCIKHRKLAKICTECMCVEMETWWDGKEMNNELHLHLRCIYTNDKEKST